MNLLQRIFLCAALNFQSSRIMLLFYTHLCIYLFSTACHKFSPIFFENMEQNALHLITQLSLRQLCMPCCFYHVYLMIIKYANRILLNILTAVSKWWFCVFIDFMRNQWLYHSRAQAMTSGVDTFPQGEITNSVLTDFPVITLLGEKINSQL